MCGVFICAIPFTHMHIVPLVFTYPALLTKIPTYGIFHKALYYNSVKYYTILVCSWFVQVDTDDYKASFIKTSDESKTLEVSDLRASTSYSVVVTAFTGELHLAYIEGTSSPLVTVSTFDASMSK